MLLLGKINCLLELGWSIGCCREDLSPKLGTSRLFAVSFIRQLAARGSLALKLPRSIPLRKELGREPQKKFAVHENRLTRKSGQITYHRFVGPVFPPYPSFFCNIICLVA